MYSLLKPAKIFPIIRAINASALGKLSPCNFGNYAYNR